MNATPHAHRVDFRDTGHYFDISYGDQGISPEKPIRFWWDSDEAYAKRCVRRAQMHIRRLIRKHDHKSRTAGRIDAVSHVALPDLRADQWGSEQL